MLALWLAAGLVAAPSAQTNNKGGQYRPQGQFVRLRVDDEQEKIDALLRRNNEALLALLM